jgi:hypothetical protein
MATETIDLTDEFEPKVYRFRFSPALNDSLTMWGLEEINAVSPNFVTLFDHTIAVIWYMFYENGRHLSRLTIADLMWALRFLEAIDTTRISELEDHTFFIEYIRKIINKKYEQMDEQNYADLSNQMLEKSIENTSNFFSTSLAEYMQHPDVSASILKECEGIEFSEDVKDPRDQLIKEAAQKISEWVENSEQKVVLDDHHRKSMENLRDKLAKNA